MENNKSKKDKDESWKDIEVKRGKERLTEIRKSDKITCCLCKNQTFILSRTSDFPFFDAICSKCGNINIG